MNFKSFVSGITSFVKRSDLLDDLDTTAKILKDVTLPLYDNASFLNQKTWSAKSNQAFQTKWSKVNKPSGKDTWVPQVHAALLNIDKTIPALRQLVQRHMSDETYREAMTFLKANLTEYSVYTGFFVRYATMLLNGSAADEVVAEAPHVNVATLNPADKKWLEDNADAFIQLYAAMSKKVDKVKADIEKTPNTVIDPEQLSYQMDLLGHSKTDPLRMGFVNSPWNPLLWAQLKIAEWSHSRYEAAKQERITVELRLAYLQNIDNADDNLLKQIRYQQDRLDRLNRRVTDYEEEVNGL